MKETLNVLMMAVFGLVLLLLITTLFACPRPQPGPGEPHAAGPIHCVAGATGAGAALAGVLGCLDGDGDATACLLDLVRLGVAAYDTVACLVRGEGSKAQQTAQAERSSPAMGVLGPAGSTSWRRAARAKDFLERTGAKFEDGGGGP